MKIKGILSLSKIELMTATISISATIVTIMALYKLIREALKEGKMFIQRLLLYTAFFLLLFETLHVVRYIYLLSKSV